jgi:hypothetical protein
MKRNILFIMAFSLLIIGLVIASCASLKVKDKSGSELWSENCQRCHNSPPISAFSDTQWEVVNAHMRVRAALTDAETKKILEFLQSSN